MNDTTSSPYIHTANGENFQSLVLDNSAQGPVMVFFWSKNAGPCMRQYPVLETLVAKHQGRFLLVNIDAEANARILKEYGVNSVPTIKLFQNSEVMETCHGYQSEADLDELLMQYITRDSDKALALALEKYTRGQHQQTYQMITEAILEDPENPRLPLALCKLFKHEHRYDDVINLLASLPEGFKKLKEVVTLKNEMDFVAVADGITDLEALIERSENKTDTLEDKVQLSAFYVLNQEYELALGLLADIIAIDANFKDDYARNSMQKIFTMIGVNHGLAKKYRDTLSRTAH